MDVVEASGKGVVMNSILLDVAGAFLMQTDWIWGVLGIIAGVLAEIAINGKLARARASRTRGRK